MFILRLDEAMIESSDILVLYCHTTILAYHVASYFLNMICITIKELYTYCMIFTFPIIFDQLSTKIQLACVHT